MKLKKGLVKVLKDNDIKFSYCGGDYVELEFYSPAGEDFVFSLTVNDFADEFTHFANTFDPDDHAEALIEAKMHGFQGVPSARELIKDADAIEEFLTNVSVELRRVVYG